MEVIGLISFYLFCLTFAGAICPDHWTRNEDICYFHDMELVTFRDATEKCNSFNATLASIHSPRQNNWINSFVSEHYVWLGVISNIEPTIADKNFSTYQASNISRHGGEEKVVNGTEMPRVTITVTQIPQNSVSNRPWKWIDGSVFNYWIWSKGDWFGMIPRQPDCNASCCTIFMNEVGSWVDEDCGDSRRLASTLCALRYGAIPSKASVEYDTESRMTISAEVTMMEKLMSYIEGNFVSKITLDERSDELVARMEVYKQELLNHSTGTWIIPFTIVLSVIVALLVLSNFYLLYQLRKFPPCSNLSIGKFNFKTLNNQISDDVYNINEDI